MTGTSFYSAADYPSAVSPERAGPGDLDASGPVQVGVAGPAAQRRATVAFRVVLAFPHFVVLYVLGAAASVVTVIGWLGALVLGRLPGFAGEYLSGYTRWYGRVAAYLLLLTDVYPPFSLSSDEGAYPVRVAVSPGSLNRLTVLLRAILAIPAAVVSLILLSGVMIVAVIAWLVALVAGHLPGSLHQAFAAVLRYTIRHYSYVYLLTDAYPAGLFGDKPGTGERAETPPGGSGYEAPHPGYETPEPASGGPWPAPGAGYPPHPGYGAPGYVGSGYGPPPGYGQVGYAQPGYGQAGYGQAGYGQAVERYGQAGYEQPGYGPAGYRETAPGYGSSRAPGHDASAHAARGRPAGWQLILAPGAKRLLGLMLALGLLTVAGAGVSAGVAINSVIQRDRAISKLNAAIASHNNAVAQMQKDAAQVSRAAAQLRAANAKLDSALNAHDFNSCATLSCFGEFNVANANANAAFARALRAIAFPEGAAAGANRLIRAVTADKKAWMYMSHAVSFTDVVNRSARGQSAGKKVDQAYSALAKLLKREATELNQKAAALDQEAAALDRRAAALNAPAKVLTFPAPSSASAA